MLTKSLSREKLIDWVSFAIIGLTLLAMFSGNFLSLVPYGAFDVYELDSESLVVSRLMLTSLMGTDAESGQLGRYETEKGATPKTLEILPMIKDPEQMWKVHNMVYEPYFSQYGLHGRILSHMEQQSSLFSLNPDLPSKVFLSHLRNLHLAVAVTTTAIILALILWIRLEVGLPAIWAVWGSIILSPALVCFGRNLYWVPATWFIPFIIVAFGLWYDSRRSQGALYFFLLFAVVGIGVFARSLCGYEFITCLLITSIVPIVFYAVRDHWTRWKFSKVFIGVSLAGLVGFFAAIVFHASALAQYQGTEGWVSGLDAIKKRALFHTVATQSESTNLKDTNKQEGVSLTTRVKVLAWYLVGWKMRATGVEVLPPFIWLAAMVVSSCRKIRDSFTDAERALLIAAWVACLSPLSWFILAPQHSYIHRHICMVLWHLPVTLLAAPVIMRTAVHLTKTFLAKLPVR